MIVNYSNKEYERENLFTNINKRVSLKEYRDNLVFYHSCNTNLTAEFGYGNKVPILTGDAEEQTENLNHGSFGQFIRNYGTLMFDKENFNLLNDRGSIKFRLATVIENTNGYQRILLDDNLVAITGQYSFNLKVGQEDPKEVVFSLTAGMNRTDIINTVLVEIDPSIYYASVDVSDLENILIRADYEGDYISITSGTTGIDFLSIYQAEETTMANAPDTPITFFQLSNGINNNSKIEFIHYKTQETNPRSLIDVNLYDNNGVLFTTLNCEWNNTSFYFTAFELDFNKDSAYLFINGNLVDIKTTRFIRDNNECNLYLTGNTDYPYDFDEIIIYSIEQNYLSYNIETSPLTKYSTENPYVDFYFNSISSIEQLYISGTNNLHFILFVEDKAFYYLSGSWRQSNGTFEYSTDLSTFELKIVDYPFYSNSNIKIRVFFNSDGVLESYLEDMYFVLSDLQNGDLDALPAYLIGEPQILENQILTGTQLIINTDRGQTIIPFGVPIENIVGDPIDFNSIPHNPGEYIVAFDLTGGEGGGDYLSIVYDTEITIDSSGVAREGYNFLGWSLEPNGPLITTLIVNQDTTLYAVWEVIEVSLSNIEIINIINQNTPIGINRSYLNTLSQIVLEGVTRGSSGFINVSGTAAPILFGSNVNAFGIDAEEEKIDYTPLFDYVKRRLGYPTVPVELTQEQMEDVLKDAINLYNKWRNYSEKIMYMNVIGNPDDGYEIPAIIGSDRNIVDIIFKPRTPFGIYDTNNFEYNIYIQQLFNQYGRGGARTGFLTDYNISLNFIADSNLVLGTTPRWEVFNKRIHIYPKAPNNNSLTIGIKYKGTLTLDEIMFDPMVKLYMVGACRKIIGSIRSTFGGTINAGETTLQMNGSEMISMGNEEMAKAESEMKGETLPLGFYVG